MIIIKKKKQLVFFPSVLSTADDVLQINKQRLMSLCFLRALGVTGKLFFWQDLNVDITPERHHIAKV